MEEKNKAAKQVDFNSMEFIIGNAQSCFAFDKDRKFSILKCSLYHLLETIEKPEWLRINDYTLINTKYCLGIKKGRTISLTGGSMHKVSRNCWKHFKRYARLD